MSLLSTFVVNLRGSRQTVQDFLGNEFALDQSLVCRVVWIDVLQLRFFGWLWWGSLHFDKFKLLVGYFLGFSDRPCKHGKLLVLGMLRHQLVLTVLPTGHTVSAITLSSPLEAASELTGIFFISIVKDLGKGDTGNR